MEIETLLKYFRHFSCSIPEADKSYRLVRKTVVRLPDPPIQPGKKKPPKKQLAPKKEPTINDVPKIKQMILAKFLKADVKYREDKINFEMVLKASKSVIENEDDESLT